MYLHRNMYTNKLIKYCIKYKSEKLKNYFHKKYIVRYNVPCMYYKVKY